MRKEPMFPKDPTIEPCDVIMDDLLTEGVQVHLPGMWISRYDGCPHLRHQTEGPDSCDANEMRPCLYEMAMACELFQEIIEEWRQEGIPDELNPCRGEEI